MCGFPIKDFGNDKEKKWQRKILFFFSLMKRSKNHTRSVFYEETAQNCAKNIILRLKSFNSALLSMVDYSEARLITLLLMGKGVRFLTCSESYPERFIDALISYFLNANSVMSGR